MTRSKWLPALLLAALTPLALGTLPWPFAGGKRLCLEGLLGEALDCGHAVNPDQIAAQVEGSVAYGLSAAFYGDCTVLNGRMTELNFDRYQLLRLAEMPKVETVIVPSHDFWGGVGEPTISVVTPAVLNAVFAATGKPVRSLPLKNVKLV